MVLPASALALVGPARQATELAPYVVMVMSGSGGETDFCTASVIARDAVLTAAHCVTDIWDTRVFFRTGEGKLVLFNVISIARHPDFEPNAGRKHRISIDLALVRLAGSLPAAFEPVELADSDSVAVGERFRIAGFGRADERVSGTSGVLRTGVLLVSKPEPAFLAWLVDPDGTGLGGCTGDSGAPILALDRPALVGVAIRAKGRNGYLCGAATETVLIKPQMPWIRDILHAWATDPSAPH